jgi:2-oxo-4-hydroxy-4-carboxy-5-ureidoimidazoline decarboxylase
VAADAAEALDLAAFNALADDEAGAALRACCASRAWVDRVLAGRPYATREHLLDAADRACRELPPADVEEALAAHPRIGERAAGASAEARWSRQEQSSVTDAEAAVRERLREGNVAYEARFDRVFLVRAAGRTPAQLLAELERRLGNDDRTEAQEILEQLAQITRLRVERLVAP